MTKKLLYSLALSAFLISCGGGGNNANTNGDGLQGEVSLSGAFALYPLAVEWAQEFQQINPGVKVDIAAGGAGKGITDALAKMVDFGMVSREIYPEEAEKGAVAFAVAKDAVVPTININNPLYQQVISHGLSLDDARKIWISGETTTWGALIGTDDQSPLHAYTRSDACGAAETWALWLGNKQEDLLGTAIYGDPGVAAAVQKDNLGIGLNNIGYAYDNETHKPNPGLAVLPIDVDGDGKISESENFYDNKDSLVKAIADDRYPSPPARNLYLVSNGVPQSEAAIEFLKFVLSKEGQQHNRPAGYIEISDEKINESLSLLK